MSPPQAAGPPDPPVPAWLRGLPRAPEYRPTESEFADPIAFLSRVEREAAAYGICKVIPPYPRPSRRFVFAHLNRSLVSSSDAPNPTASVSSNPTNSPPASTAVFTTRHQELGTPRRGRPPPQVLKQVWQSGERYTLDQFEAKSRAFSKIHLSGLREPTPLAVESLFWKASADRPIYIEYANDVPGSGFAAPAHSPRQKKRKREGVPMDEGEKTAGWRLSSSPWNLQAIARAPGSLTRFMPDDVPGVTSPMMYIGMLFSWFAWHVEDHELHSLNFLHTGAPKTWYAVPGDQAAELEEVIRIHGYGGNPDRIASLAVLGEKTTLMSPEVLVACGVSCCRLVQYPGEFVVTFPRAYHVGFSHGFNCGEAANFATPQWLKFAKEAAVRRAVMNYLPMLSHQQLLYLLAVSFICRTPRELLSGIRTSRLRDRRKEERELLVKQEFLQDMISENELVCSFLKKKSIDNVVLWEPDLLPSPTALHPCSFGSKAPEKKSDDGRRIESIQCNLKDNSSSVGTSCTIGTQPTCMSTYSKSSDATSASKEEKLDADADDEDDLPFDLSIDSGSLTCVACGILGYPFMAILQPSRKALEEISLIDRERFKLNCEKENHSNVFPCSPDDGHSGCPFIANRPSSPVEQAANFSHENVKSHKDGVSLMKDLDGPLQQHSNSSHSCSGENTLHPCINTETTEKKIPSDCFGSELSKQTGGGDMVAQAVEGCADTINWNTSCTFARPRIFCLQHALEIEELLEGKGGAHALIICHSDYIKLKALALSIAEEIEFQFDCKDVSLASASKSDLHIINISIDDEGLEEDGRDWTSQMAVNLKYCAKLRKEAPGNQERPPLSFWELFSKPSHISVVPNLKWLCRKARTPYKVVGYVSSSNTTATPEKVDPAVTKTKPGTSGNAHDNGKGQQTFQQGILLQPRRLQESNDVADMCMCSEDNDQDLHCMCSEENDQDLHCMCSEENDQDLHCLIDIPIALAEYPMMHQVCEGPVSVGTCDDSISSLNSQDSPPLAAVSAEFTIEQRGVQSAELSSSATFSVQQFLDNESITEEDSMNCISKHENVDSHNVTSECKDKQLQVQQDQENMVLCDKPNRNLVVPCPIKGVSVSVEQRSATVPGTLENEGNCGKTSYCSDTVLETNKSVNEDKPETRYPGAVLVGPQSSYDEMISSVERRCSLPMGCLASTDDPCSTEPLSIAHDLMRDEVQAIRNSKMETTSLNPVLVDTSHSNVKAIKLKSNNLTKLQHESLKRDANISEDVQAASTTAISGEDGNSVYTESNSFDILLGVLAEESKVADAPGKYEVGKASLTLMTLASDDHSADNVTQDEAVEIAGSSVSTALSYKGQTCCNLAIDKSLAIQNSKIQQKRENAEKVDGWNYQGFKDGTGILGSSASCVATTLFLPKTGKISGAPKKDQYVDRPHDFRVSNILSRSIGSSNRTDIICYVRRKRKRKRESELNTDTSQSCGCFVRSPCESLRPRTIPAVVEEVAKKTNTVEASAVVKGKRTKVGLFQCDIEFCDMTFETRAELRAHQRNVCTDESCGKRFSSHKYLKRHQCVHSDERPFKCPWDGCGMTFKWLWAQTEHVRVHTGERPYKCSAPDCGQRFRYVSDYSRHRKKFNHY